MKPKNIMDDDLAIAADKCEEAYRNLSIEYDDNKRQLEVARLFPDPDDVPVPDFQTEMHPQQEKIGKEITLEKLASEADQIDKAYMGIYFNDISKNRVGKTPPPPYKVNRNPLYIV